jgi:midasin
MIYSQEQSGQRDEMDTNIPSQPQDAADASGQGASSGAQQGLQKASPLDQPPQTNPLRNLGDTLKEIRQRFDQILESDANDAPKPNGENSQPQEVEYLRPDEKDQDMQALGAAGEEQAARLDQLHIVDEEEETSGMDTAMDVDDDVPNSDKTEKPSVPAEPLTLPSERAATDFNPEVEGAVVHQASEELAGDAVDVDEEMEKADEVLNEQTLEAELREWQSSGLPDTEAERMWHQYESLTHDLAYALCEQLRLILAPTLATRLKGDYRTGKRLNMKKIIPYIASDYTKDKIWLRRTKPSQREYQILIALDDSRSMAESHSVHLAFQTLALVSKALSRLEAGDIGIARFGETVDMLHAFDDGAPFSDAAGVQIMQAFKFNQKATNVLSLLETSLRVLEGAREKRSSASAGDLWQLEIIISDGICNDHEKLKSMLRRAEEQRIMVVFVIIDSIQTAKKGQGSILSMKRAEFTSGELQLERYLDSFPFQYYVVLRDVEALPEVLSDTLKQFFERISED